ncbi:MAG: NTP transferase domain-containing protein [Candidatus Eremiobacteraeota bacterium]|nr:NTP transferase domain-containing protein [Candidatus Eremiobacteraeota bacterium]
MKAVITAGGRIGGAYEAEAATAIKALAVTHGTSMLQRCVDALRGCGVARIAVIGEAPVRAAVSGKVEAIIDAADSGSQNVLRALRAWPEDGEPLLYLTSDMPYIDATSLQAFIDRAPPDSFAMPLCEHETFVARFPGAPNFGIRLGGERVVNGGAFHVPPGAAERLALAAKPFFDARKAPWRMAAIAGPSLLVRFALGRLNVEQIEDRARRVLNMPVRALRGMPPELAYDADTVDEFRYARDRW